MDYSVGNPKFVLEALKWRFKRVPAGLREKIQRIGDLAELQSLLRGDHQSGPRRVRRVVSWASLLNPVCGTGTNTRPPNA